MGIIYGEGNACWQVYSPKELLGIDESRIKFYLAPCRFISLLIIFKIFQCSSWDMSIYQAACNVNTHTRTGDCLPIHYQIVTENWKMFYLCWNLITYNEMKERKGM